MGSWKVYAIAALAALILFGAVAGVLTSAIRALDLLPPERLTIAAGAEGSGYYRIAQRYRAILARDGIDLEIVETAGSLENIAWVSGEDPVDLALVQGGLPLPSEAGLEAIASVFLEPLIIMHGGALEEATYPPGWQGIRVAVGAEGSGTRVIYERMTAVMGLDTTRYEEVPIGGMAASDALIAGEVDVALFVAPLSAPYLAPLIHSDRFKIAEILHSEGIATRFPNVEIVTIPEYGLDYARDKPGRRVDLITLTARLVGQDTLHPAAVNRLIAAAEEVHSPADAITAEGRFPSPLNAGLPVDSYARELMEEGPSPLARYLPYWAVAQVNALALLILPFLLVIVPLARIVPTVFEWSMRSQVYRHYPRLRAIDDRINGMASISDVEKAERELAEIDRAFAKARVTPSYRGEAYAARLHADLVRRRLRERRAALSGRESG